MLFSIFISGALPDRYEGKRGTEGKHGADRGSVTHRLGFPLAHLPPSRMAVMLHTSAHTSGWPRGSGRSSSCDLAVTLAFGVALGLGAEGWKRCFFGACPRLDEGVNKSDSSSSLVSAALHCFERAVRRQLRGLKQSRRK